MCQFGYLQIILRPSYGSSPSSVCHRDLGVILDDFESHLVPFHGVNSCTLGCC